MSHRGGRVRSDPCRPSGLLIPNPSARYSLRTRRHFVRSDTSPLWGASRAAEVYDRGVQTGSNPKKNKTGAADVSAYPANAVRVFYPSRVRLPRQKTVLAKFFKCTHLKNSPKEWMLLRALLIHHKAPQGSRGDCSRSCRGPPSLSFPEYFSRHLSGVFGRDALRRPFPPRRPLAS